MSQFQDAIVKASKAYNDWYEKNRWVVSILGLSWNEAAFQRAHVDGIAGDLLLFSKGIKKFIAICLLVLTALSITHFLVFLSTVGVCNLISIYFGLIGSFLASYGFLLGLKRHTGTKACRKTIRMPDIPVRPEDFSRYAERMNKIVADVINAGVAEKDGQVKLELRRQFSLAIGFIMLFFSFAIQIVLAFIRG